MDLFTPDLGLIFWMFVSFAVLFFILWKFAWPVILKTVDSRADLIDKGVEYAQNAKQQLDEAKKNADQYIADARRQQVEAQKVMDAAKVQIEQQQKEAQHQFRNQVSDFALQIAEKVVKNQMADTKAQTKLVDKLLDEMADKN